LIFNSVTYLIFLVLVVSLYWLLPTRPRKWLIFLSSLTFYAFWRPEFLSILLLSTVVDYKVALEIYRSTDKTKRKLLLGLSLLVNLGLLCYFKYLFFFADSVVALFHIFDIAVTLPAFNIILPLGISFYTFQTISYTIDVYRGFIPPERDFVLYGCYVTFFPQLVAGPILRAGEVIHQFVNRPHFNLYDIGIGVRRILYGLFLKVVLADNIAPLVDTGFAQPVGLMSALDVWTLAFLFGFQIYFDFSGYSHIAIGSARLMGIRFPENFNFPYMATSPRDFWQRWHIALSSWVRDYLYLPLLGVSVHDRSIGGLPINELSKAHNVLKKNIALFVTWGIMGLWHGASWGFVFWGIYHAVFILLYRITSPLIVGLSDNVNRIGGWLITVPVCMLGWVFFRSQSLPDALVMYGKLFDPVEYFYLGMRESYYLVAALVMLSMILCYYFKEFLMPTLRKHAFVSTLVETGAFTCITGLVFVFLRPINQFIYFQF